MIAFLKDLLRPPTKLGGTCTVGLTKYRVVTGMAIAMTGVALFYMVLDFRDEGPSGFSLAMSGVIGLALCIRSMLRQGRSVESIGQVTTVGLFMAATFVTLHSGGGEATSIGWYAMLPLSAALLCGYRAGMAWAVVSLTSLLIIGQLANLGIEIPDALPKTSRNLYRLFENLLLLAGVAYLVTGFIAEHKRAQDELEMTNRMLDEERNARTQADKRVNQTLQIQNQILAKVGSEMRTPLNGIKGMTRMLNSTNLDQVQKDYAVAIQSSGRALLELLEDVLDFSRIESGELQLDYKPFDIEVAVAGVAKHLSTIAEVKNLEVLLRFAPDTPRFYTGDAGRIQQVLGSLVKNGVKHATDGHVLIDVEETDRDGNDSILRFHVRNSGVSLDKGECKALRQMLANQDEDGSSSESDSGFGLALSQRIVRLMGGDMGFDGDGEEADFWFSLTLPRSREPKVQNLFSGNLAGLKALVVEDNARNREILVEQLMSWGIQPVLASSGQKALQMMHVDQDSNCPYDLAIIDHQLEDIDGKRLGMMMQSDSVLEECCMVLLTSDAGAGRGREYRTAGFSAYLAKPVTPSILRDTLAMAWGLDRETKVAQAANQRDS
ncbi:MAG: ATP-binding protein [Planctomycetota bacterium]|nr:ATP-binding protein [Planctomycetota bacterium]